MTSTISSVRDAGIAGADAYENGKPRHANPEPPGTIEWYAWDVSWWCAKENAELARFRAQQSEMRAVGT